MTLPQPPALSFRESIARIDVAIPLTTPLVSPTMLPPRVERAEAKVAFLADYVEYLEGRIAALEAKGS